MKSTNTYLFPLFALLFMVFITSCEQEEYEPQLSVAPGGGTISTYKAYTLVSSDPGGQNIYGRVVFWKDNSGYTLVQIGLYNTVATQSYTATIFGGTTSAPGSSITTLYTVDGSTGAFGTSKFFVISDKTFFDKLNTYNANVRVSLAATIVASGNIGANAEAVAEAE
jgi:hypothetical protein